MNRGLKGKICLVTGSSGGLGSAFCRRLAEGGATVAAAGRSLERLEPVVAGLAGSDPHMPVRLDTAEWESVEAGVREVENRLGRIDVVVNNAAVYGDLTRAPFWDLPIDEWDRVLSINVRGPMLVGRAAVPGMRRRGEGRIINITSATFWSGSANWAHYVASKGALIGLTRSMAKELGPDGICVNAVAPGFTLTDASLHLIPGGETYGVDRGCLKRAQAPDDVVGIVAFLASDESAFITGQTIIVDGGREFS